MAVSKIKIERVKAGLHQAQLADRVNMQQAAFSRLERGLQDITVTQLMKIAKALNVPAKDLLPDEE